MNFAYYTRRDQYSKNLWKGFFDDPKRLQVRFLNEMLQIWSLNLVKTNIERNWWES